MANLIDFPPDVLLVLLEQAAKTVPTPLLPLVTSHRQLWDLYCRPYTKLALTRDVVKGHLNEFFDNAKGIVIVEGSRFNLVKERRDEKTRLETQGKNAEGKQEDVCGKANVGTEGSEDVQVNDELILERKELQLLHAMYSLHQTILAICRMLVDEREQDPPQEPELDEEYLGKNPSFAIDNLIQAAYADRAKVWGDNECGHCDAGLSNLSDEIGIYVNLIVEQSPHLPLRNAFEPGTDMYRTENGVDQWGLLAQRYYIDIWTSGVRNEIEDIYGEVDLEWVSIQCFNVAEHYNYLKTQDIRERLKMLATNCTHHT